MSNHDAFIKAREKADLEIKAHLEKENKHTAATAQALIYLEEYLPWYKHKFKKTATGYKRDKIILELKNLFGNDIDESVIKKKLTRNGIISSGLIFIIFCVLIPSILFAIVYMLTDYNMRAYVFIATVIEIILVIFGIICTESSIIRFYRLPKITEKL